MRGWRDARGNYMREFRKRLANLLLRAALWLEAGEVAETVRDAIVEPVTVRWQAAP